MSITWGRNTPQAASPVHRPTPLHTTWVLHTPQCAPPVHPSEYMCIPWCDPPHALHLVHATHHSAHQLYPSNPMHTSWCDPASRASSCVRRTLQCASPGVTHHLCPSSTTVCITPHITCCSSHSHTHSDTTGMGNMYHDSLPLLSNAVVSLPEVQAPTSDPCHLYRDKEQYTKNHGKMRSFTQRAPKHGFLHSEKPSCPS